MQVIGPRRWGLHARRLVISTRRAACLSFFLLTSSCHHCLAMPSLLHEPSTSGFDFGLHSRNARLSTQKGLYLPKATSTGTTIVGCVFKDGIVLGADTRATEGPIVADKNCEKIHYITDNIRCCGAGTAADTEFVTALISSNMQLHEFHTGRKARVVTAMTMLKQRLFQYQGQIGAALVLGGFDETGPNLFTVAPHGSTDKLPYVTMGSGSLAAMSVFETSWTKGMDVSVSPFSLYPELYLLTLEVIARISNRSSSSSNFFWYLQRFRIWFQR